MKKQENQPLSPVEKKARRKRRVLRTLVIFIGILVMIRIALPVVALRLVNKKLAGLPEYLCQVDDLEISLMTQSVTLHGIEMKKKNGKIKVPFFKCNEIHVHVASFKHRASEIKVDSCVINMVKGPNKDLSQLSLDEEWIQLAKNMPLKPNMLVVNCGEVHYREFYNKPNIDVAVKQIHIQADNLENLKGVTDSLPSRVELTGIAEGAKLKSVIRLDHQSKKPIVKSVTTLAPMQLKSINDVLRAYTKFDVESGTFSLYSQLNLKNNRFSGYAKPVVKDLVLFDMKKDKDKPLKKRIAEAALQIGANIFKNNKTGKIITRIELEGTVKNPKISIWQILVEGLSNSFSQSIRSGLANPHRNN